MRLLKHVSKADITFDKIYKELWQKVFRFIYYKVQNNEEAEELTQDVFQRVLPQVKEGNINENKIKAYVFTAARNIVYDTWRKRGRDLKVVHLDEMREKGFELEYKNRVVEDNIVVNEAMDKLQDHEKEVLILRIIKGYTISEVSEITKRPEGTVKSLQFRALQKLRDILDEGGFFDE